MCALGHPPSEVQFTLVMATGDPGEEIVRAAREQDADLVVLAWHGVWEPERATTMRRVIRGVGCPMLVVQTGDRGTPAARRCARRSATARPAGARPACS